MAVPGTQREGVLAHLTAAAFETRVAAGFECLQGTPAHASLRAAEAKIADARAWAIANPPIERPLPGTPKPFAGLPLTRRERLSFPHLRHR
jgi:hypothetical protein